jgi:hypothetical protein
MRQDQGGRTMPKEARSLARKVAETSCVAALNEASPCDIDLIALTITVRYGSQFADVGHDHFVPKLQQLLADPDRVNACLPGHTCRRQVRKPFLDRLWGGPETARSTTSPSWLRVQ